MSTERFTESERAVFARAIVEIFEAWGLLQEDLLMLLGMNRSSRPTFSRYREGLPVAQRRDLLERASHLFALHASLTLSKVGSIATWWADPIPRVKLSPTEIARTYGLVGLGALRNYVTREAVARSRRPWTGLGLAPTDAVAIQRLIDTFEMTSRDPITLRLRG